MIYKKILSSYRDEWWRKKVTRESELFYKTREIIEFFDRNHTVEYDLRLMKILCDFSSIISPSFSECKPRLLQHLRDNGFKSYPIDFREDVLEIVIVMG